MRVVAIMIEGGNDTCGPDRKAFSNFIFALLTPKGVLPPGVFLINKYKLSTIYI